MSAEAIDMNWMKKPSILNPQQKICYIFNTADMPIDQAIKKVKAENAVPFLANVFGEDGVTRNGMVTSFSPSQAKVNTLYMMHATVLRDRNLLLFSAQIVSEAGQEVRIYQEKWHLPC